MRIVLVSRYPLIDVLAWKRELGDRLLAGGHGVGVVSSRAHIRDYAAFVRSEKASRLIRDRLGSRAHERRTEAGARAMTLSRWARAKGMRTAGSSRLSDPKLHATIAGWRPELAILVGADIVPSVFLRLFPSGVINAHFGSLPEYRGMNAAEWSVYNDAQLAVTVHFVDSGVDTGDVIAERTVLPNPGDGFSEIREAQRATAVEIARRRSYGDLLRIGCTCATGGLWRTSSLRNASAASGGGGAPPAVGEVLVVRALLAKP